VEQVVGRLGGGEDLAAGEGGVLAAVLRAVPRGVQGLLGHGVLLVVGMGGCLAEFCASALSTPRRRGAGPRAAWGRPVTGRCRPPRPRRRRRGAGPRGAAAPRSSLRPG